MNRLALIAAAVMSALGIALLILYQQRFEQEASGGRKIEVLQAQTTIARGQIIKEEMISSKSIPISYVDEREIKYDERAKIVGVTASNTIKAGQMLMWPDIVSSSSDDQSLSQLVSPGSRAVQLTVAKDISSISLIHPGDLVDVVLITGSERGDQQAQVLFQKVTVLAVGNTTARDPDQKSTSIGDPSITLSVRLEEMQKLALATQSGRIAVAVRNGEDSSISLDPRVLTAKDLRGDAVRPPASNRPQIPVIIGSTP